MFGFLKKRYEAPKYVYKVTYSGNASIIDDEKVVCFEMKNFASCLISATDKLDAARKFVTKVIAPHPHLYIHNIEKVIVAE